MKTIIFLMEFFCFLSYIGIAVSEETTCKRAYLIGAGIWFVIMILNFFI